MPSDPDWEEDEDDFGDDESPETISCPYCRRQVYEDAERCPYCEKYISDEDAPLSRKPLWIVLGVGVCLWIVYTWLF